MNHNSVYAIVVSEGQALQIEESLTKAGFSNDEISALIPDKDLTSKFPSNVEPNGSYAKTGGVLGAALDLLASIGMLSIPGVGRVVAAGPLFVSLSAIAAAGATAFGIAGALVGLGIPEMAATRYETRIAGGNILLSVHTETPERLRKAKEVLEFANAEDIAVGVMLENRIAIDMAFNQGGGANHHTAG